MATSTSRAKLNQIRYRRSLRAAQRDYGTQSPEARAVKSRYQCW